MNLHAIASPIVSSVNPSVTATMKVNVGFSTNAAGVRSPAYEIVLGVAQVQALNYNDLRQIEGLNLNGTRVSIYFHGKFEGTSRPTNKGGDLVVLDGGPNTGTWLIAYVTEQWPDWCKVICTLQNGS